jgi:hypothetical protein
VDFIIKLIFLFFISSSVFAVPSLPTFGITRAGAVTTYTVGPSTFQPATIASTGTGLQPLNSAFSAAGRTYATTSSIPIGETIAAVRVSSGISAASLASAVLSFSKSPLGLASIVAGTALYSYLQQSNLVVDSGGLGNPTPSTVPLGVYYYTPDCPNSISSSAHEACHILSVCIGSGYTSSNCPYINNPSTINYNDSGIAGSTFQVLQNSRLLYNGSIRANITCPTNYSLVSGICTFVGVPVVTPVSDSVALSQLTTNQPTDAAPVIKQLYDSNTSGSYAPVADVSPVINLDTSPMYGPSDGDFNPGHLSSTQTSSSTPPVSVTTPTGTTQSTTSQTTLSQPSTTTIDATTTTTTTTINNDNSTKTTTVTNAPPAPTTKTDNPTDCDKYPDDIGCSKYGIPATPDLITTDIIPISLTPTSLGTGTCPSPNVLSLSGGKTLTFSYQPMCDFATMSAPLTIAFAWLAAGFLVLGSVRD